MACEENGLPSRVWFEMISRFKGSEVSMEDVYSDAVYFKVLLNFLESVNIN